MKLRALVLALPACTSVEPRDAPWAWELPAHLSAPVLPDGASMSAAKVELGRHLFYEERLSVSGDVSCGTCHVQALAFTDGQAVSIGADGRPGTRSAMSLANVAYLPTLTWGNPVLDTLEEQALVPLFLDLPLEMGAQYVIDDALEHFAGDPAWIDRFEAAFSETDPFTVANVAAALAAFERTLVSADSPYDRWLQGDDAALDDAALRGLALFESDRLGCAHCHAGVLQTASFVSEAERDGTSRFENTGLYDVDGAGGYPQPNTGLFEFTHDRRDIGRHRVPSLRNVAVTAPYMHDGSIADLEGVIDHYAAGGRTIVDGPHAGDGSRNPNKSPRVGGFAITAAKRADLVAFLHALTDATFLEDPRFADPALD